MEGICMLPGGFFQDEVCFREVKLSPPAGKVEELLAEGPDSRCLASRVTDLLAHCIERIGPLTDITPALVRGLLAGDRDYLVLKLMQLTMGNRVQAVMVCPNPRCGRKIDMDFNLSDVPVKQGGVTAPAFSMELPKPDAAGSGTAGGGCRVDFRLPTGGDQEDLASLVVESEEQAVAQLLARCIRRMDGKNGIDIADISGLPASARNEIEARMEELAPQVEMEMEAICPECEKGFSFLFNVSQLFIDELNTDLDRLYREVHFLAFHYKWAEADILAMPRRKRRRYLELLNDQLEAAGRGHEAR